MSKWDAFSEHKKKINTSGGLFAPVHESYKAKKSFDMAIDAAAQVSKEITRNFQMCDRLPKQPVFKTDDGDITVKDGVMGAMGEAVAEILNLAQTQEVTASIGLGLSGSSSAHDPESDS